ncbi:T9SS type B sorting domain-containing protein [Croceivirga radicis]|uniref:T9SS type B sorting domain-containing protein n=1 Tax=Croceivirga radicis TaxID=1929488 RepID=UPI000255B882|nr:gliding motility-associated C-terminal domain-containing protein [Croceivirga radicis]
MKKLLYILFFILSTVTTAQDALFNSGGFQLHDNGAIGFHTNWINTAPFVAEQGLVGFYGDNPVQVLGNSNPTLFDLELFAPGGIFLGNTININNNANFIAGNLLSSLNNNTVYLNFMDNAFFTGEDDLRKVSGIAAITNKRIFSFPVGDVSMLRPLTLSSENTNAFASCKYLFQNPNNPFSIEETFDTQEKIRDIGEISEREFWVLTGTQPSRVTINWNTRSELFNLANSVDDIILVGWSKANAQWVIIGNSALSGDVDQGFLTSETFVPDDYAALTFGTVPLPTDTFAVNNPTLGNYFVSPNADGINDVLIFDALDPTAPNEVYIYNRFGQRVFYKENYTNEFAGFSNIDNFVVGRDKGLPPGIYYYTVSLPQQELNYQGFFYLKD